MLEFLVCKDMLFFSTPADVSCAVLRELRFLRLYYSFLNEKGFKKCGAKSFILFWKKVKKTHTKRVKITGMFLCNQKL